MLYLFRQIRRKAMNENKLSTYLLYAVGEIILVVVGILIAVQIDDWNEDKQKARQQLKYYQNILTDLKKDSVHFNAVLNGFKRRQANYYAIFREVKNSVEEEERPIYDYLLYNAQFAPTMIKNQQQVIDDIKDIDVRQLINEYGENLVSVQIAIDEYNMCVYELIRPYTLNKKAWNVENVFQPDIYAFLPKEAVIDQASSKKLFGDDELLQLLAYQRISSGFSITELEGAMQVNEKLMSTLRTKLEE